MKKKTAQIGLGLFVVSLLLVFGLQIVKAQSEPFTLVRAVIGSGGMGGSERFLTINSTLGQSVAGPVTNLLTSGFWVRVGTSISQFFNFIPAFFR